MRRSDHTPAPRRLPPLPRAAGKLFVVTLLSIALLGAASFPAAGAGSPPAAVAASSVTIDCNASCQNTPLPSCPAGSPLLYHFVLPAQGHPNRQFVSLTASFSSPTGSVSTAQFTHNNTQTTLSVPAGTTLTSATAQVTGLPAGAFFVLSDVSCGQAPPAQTGQLQLCKSSANGVTGDFSFTVNPAPTGGSSTQLVAAGGCTLVGSYPASTTVTITETTTGYTPAFSVVPAAAGAACSPAAPTCEQVTISANTLVAVTVTNTAITPPAPCGSSNSTVPTITPTGPFVGPPDLTGPPSTLPSPTQTGAVLDTSNSCSPAGSKITVTTTTALRAICGWVGPVDPTALQNQFSVAIYADASGQPGTLIANSGVGTLTADSWNCLPVSASLPAGSYWLLLWSNSCLGSSSTTASCTGASSSGHTADPCTAASTAPATFDNLCKLTGSTPGTGVFWTPAALTTFGTSPWPTPLSSPGSWTVTNEQYYVVALVGP